MKQYRVLKATVVEGAPVRSGDLVKSLTEEAAKPYLKSKVIEEVKPATDASGKEVETFDVAPSEKPNMATQTKGVVTEDYYQEPEAAQADPKAPDKKD